MLATDDPAHPVGSLTEVIAGVAATGHDIRSTHTGHPQPMPPELEIVAYRVLQEMLTNAIRHGHRSAPITVERHWGDYLQIVVRNQLAAPTPATAASSGQGIDGMRRRVEAVGGALDIRQEESPDGIVHAASAWIPVRATR